MTREEAIRIIRETYHTDEEMNALESLIPELRESEDERIIHFFAELATDACGGPGQEYYEELGLNYDKVMTWLEKQKEQKPKNILTDDDSLQTAYLKGQTDVLEDPEAYGLQKESAEWSEEDEKNLGQVISGRYLPLGLREWFCGLPERFSSRPSWKPSEEQMNRLCAVVDAAIRKHNESVSGYEPARVLKSLYEDLEKL